MAEIAERENIASATSST